MIDSPLVRFTAHQLTRDDLHALMVRSDGPALLRAFGLFAWNMSYHAEHHAFPAVPFHALPALHERVRARIANLDPGYVAATLKVNRYLFGGDDAHKPAGLR